MKNMNRREFLKTLGAGVAGVIILTSGIPEFSYSEERVKENFFETPIGKEKLEIIKARQRAMYQDDKLVREKFQLAASHENPAIKEFYLKFAHHPLSEVSEILLHTTYKPRR